MKNVAFDRTPFLQLDPVGADSALDAAADCHVLRNDVALDLSAIANHEIGSAQFTVNSAKDLRCTFAFDFANNRHVRADAGGRSRFCRRPVMWRSQVDFVLALFRLGCAALEATQHIHLPFFRCAPPSGTVPTLPCLERRGPQEQPTWAVRSEEHTSEL